MAYLTKEDLSTHIYPEIAEEITRSDDDLIDEAIGSAIDEAKSYLSRYDLDKLFGDPPTPADRNLKNKVKDMACWHLIRLANPNVNLELFRTIYKDAITWLTGIMKGQANPAGWIYLDMANVQPPPDGDTISYSSNPKRQNHL